MGRSDILPRALPAPPDLQHRLLRPRLRSELPRSITRSTSQLPVPQTAAHLTNDNGVQRSRLLRSPSTPSVTISPGLDALTPRVGWQLTHRHCAGPLVLGDSYKHRSTTLSERCGLNTTPTGQGGSKTALPSSSTRSNGQQELPSPSTVRPSSPSRPLSTRSRSHRIRALGLRWFHECDVQRTACGQRTPEVAVRGR